MWWMCEDMVASGFGRNDILELKKGMKGMKSMKSHWYRHREEREEREEQNEAQRERGAGVAWPEELTTLIKVHVQDARCSFSFLAFHDSTILC